MFGWNGHDYGSPEDDVTEVEWEEHQAETFNAAHPTCETCGVGMCAGELEACEGGCSSGWQSVVFRWDGHAFCGVCADETKDIIMQDIYDRDSGRRS